MRAAASAFFVGFIAIVLCGAPATVLVGRHVTKQSDVDWTSVQVYAVVAAVGFVVFRTVRAAASRRYVDAAVQSRRPGISPTFACTLVAWVLVASAGGLAFGTYQVYDTANDPNPGKYRVYLAHQSLPVLFLAAGLAVLGAAGYYSWNFRRKHEIPELKKHNIVSLAADVRPKRTMAGALKKRILLWLKATLIDGFLFAGAIVPRLFSDNDRPTAAEIGDGLNLVVGGPGIVSFALLVCMFVFGATRHSAFDALRQPSSLAAIGIFLIGLVLQENDLKLAAGICAFTAVLIASATMLNIMERGSQPWMGFIFLVANYWYGYLVAPDGNEVLPVGVAGWVVAIMAAGYTAHEAREHWREWNTLVEPDTIPLPVLAFPPTPPNTSLTQPPPFTPPR